MTNTKQFLAGFTGSAVAFAASNVLPPSRWFPLDNAISSIGFPFTFAYIGEFGGLYHYDVLAAGVDTILGLALALLGGYLWTNVRRRTRA